MKAATWWPGRFKRQANMCSHLSKQLVRACLRVCRMALFVSAMYGWRAPARAAVYRVESNVSVLCDVPCVLCLFQVGGWVIYCGPL